LGGFEINRSEMPMAQFDRWVAPADLATVTLFLASEESRAVTNARTVCGLRR